MREEAGLQNWMVLQAVQICLGGRLESSGRVAPNLDSIQSSSLEARWVRLNLVEGRHVYILSVPKPTSSSKPLLSNPKPPSDWSDASSVLDSGRSDRSPLGSSDRGEDSPNPLVVEASRPLETKVAMSSAGGTRA